MPDAAGPEVTEAFDQSKRYAQGQPTPEEAQTARMVDAATKDIKPDEPHGPPNELEGAMQDTQDGLARLEAAGLMTDADKMEVETSKGWLEQAAAIGKGLARAAACLT